MKPLLISCCLVWAIPLVADEPPAAVDLDTAPSAVLDIGDEPTIEEPFELDEIIVTSERFTLEQEAGLRLVRQALKETKSNKREDRNKWVCWFRKPVGTHMTHLECARNGDINALLPEPLYPPYLDTDGPEFGKIWRSQRPVHKGRFREIVASLPGSADFDREFVALQLAGQTPPRDIPTADELDRFTAAYRAVNDERETDENALIARIESAGLTLARYNRIVDLVETYQSLQNEVASRLQTEGRAGD